MAKRTTVLSSFANLTAAPANSVFPIDGDWAEIFVQLTALVGTTPTLQAEVVQVDKTLVLPYDGQTANYTVGKRVKGTTSNATGLVVQDVDGDKQSKQYDRYNGNDSMRKSNLRQSSNL